MSRNLMDQAMSSGALAGLTAAVVLACPSAQAQEEMPEVIEVTGVIRDFQERQVPGGHADFEKKPDHGFGRYSGNIAYELGPDDKPVFTGAGRKITVQWRDAEHRQISHLLYDPSLGDIEGGWGASSMGGITSADSFDQWFRDVPGLNLSAPLTLRLLLQADGQYVFDDRYDPVYADLGGFFPIDDQLFGNSAGQPDHNFHFTFELHLEFEYDAAGDQYFMFIGDDDVWVFIDGQLTIDLGGVHAAHDQYVDLDRLGLTDGETYNIDFFFAERHRPQSNFRIETNIPVRSAGLPPTTAAFD